MLTNARLDSERYAQLLALMAVYDWAKPKSESGEDIKQRLIKLDRSWYIRTFFAQSQIAKFPPNKSRYLRSGSFIDPIMDFLSKRLEHLSESAVDVFSVSIDLSLDETIWARVMQVCRRSYNIDVGIKLIVQLFLGAITLSQNGSKVSATLLNPYQPQYGAAAIEIFSDQEPLLQALSVSAFKHLLPKEPWRQLLAYGIFAQAMEFISQHELGHAIRGHLEFVAERGMVAERSEDGSGRGAIADLTHQLMEAQADDHAAASLVYRRIFDCSTHDFKKCPLMLGRFGFSVTCPQHAQLVSAYAVTLLFFILDAADRGVRVIGAPTLTKRALYPTAAYRS